jgi:hypothetical protein
MAKLELADHLAAGPRSALELAGPLCSFSAGAASAAMQHALLRRNIPDRLRQPTEAHSNIVLVYVPAYFGLAAENSKQSGRALWDRES